MEPYNSFIFASAAFDADERRAELRYSLDGVIKFLETVDFPAGVLFQQVSLELVERALQALHLTGGASYFKTCCPKEISVESAPLDPRQAAFFETLYTRGLAEFFYRNHIDPTGRIRFPSEPKKSPRPIIRPKAPGRVLVPIGGGKDSIVAIELLKHAGHDVTLLRMNSHPLIDALAVELKLPMLTIERTLSPLLFTLNQEGALNGHVPITAYLTFASVLTAIIYGFDAVVLSNERSADEGNATVNGQSVNHQWSKSLEAEDLISAYIRDWITPDLAVFSLLRPWSELKIVEEFSRMPQYFPLVTSCNRNWKILEKGTGERWCGECPKCASSFALFAAFLPRKTLTEIFGSNLFDDPTLTLLYRELLGIEGLKPFECVGSREDIQAAFLLAHRRGELEETPAMQLFLKESLPTITDPDALIQRALSPSKEHRIPAPFLPALDAHA
ncbi:hypothetical protein COU80_03300 [Candidatus Peregrinibacteria bacterium CG10_big_fil_rev_8_21_14_0_10_55_24]|nr:MAG: hypothetical protein COU80_03300 [Candidatus Peregrinibacteria bacterium CG10_big_fil_rev_8_21_14_0_10_55_24]